MKILSLIAVLMLAQGTFAQENFESLTKKYEAASQPIQADLMKSRWLLVKMVANYSLALNNSHHDYLDENGIKNYDGSQMIWEFVGYNHPLFQFTLTKKNFLNANHNVLMLQVKSLPESKSIAYAFSAYPSGKQSDIYYVQHCRMSAERRLICPATLKVTEEALKKYPSPALQEANNQITLIQEFKAE